MPMGIKFGRIGTYNEEQGHVKILICYISTTTMSMATKPGRVVKYNEQLPSITTPFDHVVLQVLLPQSLWPLKLVVSYYKELPRIKSHNPLNRWSHDRLNTLYLYHHKASGHWQGSCLLGEASTPKVTEPFPTNTGGWNNVVSTL